MKKTFKSARSLLAGLLAAAVSLTLCACKNSPDSKKNTKPSDKTSSVSAAGSDSTQFSDYELDCDEKEIGFAPDKELIERVSQQTIELAKAVCAEDTDTAEKLLNTSVTRPLYKTSYNAEDVAKKLTKQFSGKFTSEQLDSRVTKIELANYYDIGGSLKNGLITEEDFKAYQKQFDEQGFTLESELAEMTVKIYLDGDNPIMIGGNAVCWDGKTGFTNFGLDTLSHFQAESDLAQANENAKNALAICAQYMTEQEQLEIPFDETLDKLADTDIDLSDVGSYGGAVGEAAAAISEAGCTSGIVRIIKAEIDGTNTFAVQWRESPDSGVIGQYPYAIHSEDLDKVEWGNFYE